MNKMDTKKRRKGEKGHGERSSTRAPNIRKNGGSSSPTTARLSRLKNRTMRERKHYALWSRIGHERVIRPKRKFLIGSCGLFFCKVNTLEDSHTKYWDLKLRFFQFFLCISVPDYSFLRKSLKKGIFFENYFFTHFHGFCCSIGFPSMEKE